jgi:hypothetical protein
MDYLVVGCLRARPPITTRWCYGRWLKYQAKIWPTDLVIPGRALRKASASILEGLWPRLAAAPPPGLPASSSRCFAEAETAWSVMQTDTTLRQVCPRPGARAGQSHGHCSARISLIGSPQVPYGIVATLDQKKIRRQYKLRMSLLPAWYDAGQSEGEHGHMVFSHGNNSTA